MGPAWYGHMYCCDGIPDESVKVVEVIDYLGNKIVLGEQDESLSKRTDNSEEIKILKFENSTSLVHHMKYQLLKPGVKINQQQIL